METKTGRKHYIVTYNARDAKDGTIAWTCEKRKITTKNIQLWIHANIVRYQKHGYIFEVVEAKLDEEG